MSKRSSKQSDVVEELRNLLYTIQSTVDEIYISKRKRREELISSAMEDTEEALNLLNFVKNK